MIVAFGLTSRVAHKSIELARDEGLKVGLLRPQSLFPFPSKILAELAEQVEGMLVVEMNAGQMVEDVRLAVNGRIPVYFHGRMGGVIPQPVEILDRIKQVYNSKETEMA